MDVVSLLASVSTDAWHDMVITGTGLAVAAYGFIQSQSSEYDETASDEETDDDD